MENVILTIHLILALLLSLRLREVFPAIRQSATLLVQWLREQLRIVSRLPTDLVK